MDRVETSCGVCKGAIFSIASSQYRELRTVTDWAHEDDGREHKAEPPYPIHIRERV